MRARVTPAEQDLIERTLRFANLRVIANTLQVEQLFAEATMVRAGDVFGTLSVSEVATYRRDQKGLRERLAAIASGNVRERRDLTEKANELLATVPTRLGLVGQRLVFGFTVRGVGPATWLALAFLLDEGRGLTNRLGQCRKPGCGRFNLTFEGRPRIFCNEQHRLAYDRSVAADRARKWRDDRRARAARAAQKERD
jgi:hypothetical protein